MLAGLTAIAAALSFGYLGRLHPALDSFSHFRVHLAVLLLLMLPVLLLLRLRIEALFAAALGLATLGQTWMEGSRDSVVPPSQPVAGAVYKLLQLNIFHLNPTPEAVISLIGEVRPDVVTLNEVSSRWYEKLALLEAAYPHTIICEKPRDIGGAVIMSRRPFATGFHPLCGANGTVAQLRLDFAGQDVDIAAVHLGWPWPYHQQHQVPEVAQALRHVGPTGIVVGDLNAAPWSHAAKTLAAGAEARILRGIGPTYFHGEAPLWMRKYLGLPIDNVMVKGAVVPLSVRTIDGGNSDHAPVLLEFTLLPEEERANVLQAGLRQ